MELGWTVDAGVALLLDVGVALLLGAGVALLLSSGIESRARRGRGSLVAC